ncbi:MAG TPA: hypothetical protein VGD67_14695, partial [Pseudonocardiaceae bacterium]
MSRRWRLAVLAALLLVTGLTAYVAGRSSPPSSPPAEVQRLGPEPGEPVPAYLARARATLPAADAGEVWALVQVTAPLDAATAAALTPAR